MSASEGQARLETRVALSHRTAAIIVLAMIVSIIMYVAIGALILRRAAGSAGASDIRLPLYGAAAALALASIALRRVLLLRLRLESVAQRRGVEGLLKYLFIVTLISAALGEAVGIVGLLMIFFGGDEIDLIRIGIVALIVSLYNYPRLGTWRRVVEYFAATQPLPEVN